MRSSKRGSCGELSELWTLVNRHAPLSGTETPENIALMLAETDPRRRDELRGLIINRNLRLCVIAALNLRVAGQKSNLSLHDLFQEGVIGLQAAVDHYNQAKSTSFYAYSRYWIRAYMLTAINGRGSSTVPPVSASAKEIVRNVAYCRDRLQREGVKEPTVEESVVRLVSDPIGRHTNTKEIRIALCAANWSASPLDGQPHDPDHGRSLHEVIPHNGPATDDLVANAQLEAQIPSLLEILSQRERAIVSQYFGLTTADPMTYEAIGYELGLTKERIRQIVNESLGRLRRLLTGKHVLVPQTAP